MFPVTFAPDFPTSSIPFDVLNNLPANPPKLFPVSDENAFPKVMTPVAAFFTALNARYAANN